MTEQLQFITDSQQLDSVSLCEQKFVYDFMKNLTQANSSRKLEMGLFLHDLYAVYYRNLNEHGHETAQLAAIKCYIELCAERTLDEGDISIVVNAFQESTNFWLGEGGPITVKSVETPIVKLLHEDESLRIAYVSKIDLVIDGVNFENMPMDHKSEHSRSDPEPLANQFTGYAWATESNRIIVNKVGFQKTLKPIDKFRRYPIYYTEQQKLEWVEDTIEWCKVMIELINGRAPKKNRTSCDKWGGCKYKMVCGASPENRDFILNEHYVEREPWNPLDVKHD